MTDLFAGLDPNAPVDEALLDEVKQQLGTMSKEMLSGKLKEANLVQQSMADGGPGGSQEAIINLMEVTQIGIRNLAKQVGVGRKILVRMIEGVTPMPPETLTAIVDIFRKARPDLFAFETSDLGGNKTL